MSKNYLDDLNEDAEKLQKKWKLTAFEALQIAVQNQRNEIIADCFGIHSGHQFTSLEIIAKALGYPHSSIPEDLSTIADSISDLASAIGRLKPSGIGNGDA